MSHEIFIWKCSCGYQELWEEWSDSLEDSRRYFTRKCPKCEADMTRRITLRQYANFSL